MNSAVLTAAVKRLAIACGFSRVGVAPTNAFSPEHLLRFQQWLEQGNHAGLTFLAREPERRYSPADAVGQARSVICLAVGYAPPQSPAETGMAASPAVAPAGLIARIARGRDYHLVLKARAQRLIEHIGRLATDFHGLAFVDSSPVSERSLAAAAGLGWIGRNGCLIVPGLGSYVALAEVFSNLPLECDSPLPADCGECNACLSACPSGALLGDGLIDVRRCVSFLTQSRFDPPEELRAAMGRWIWGCDACQDACPHNRGLPAGDPELTGPGALPLDRLGQADFLAELKGRESLLANARPSVLARNAEIARKNQEGDS